MITEFKIIKCETCGKQFSSYYDNGGSIEHENYVSDWNMYVLTRRFYNNSYEDRYKIFLDSITLGGNYCNIKNNKMSVGIEIFNCRVKWLRNHNFNDIANYLESNINNIEHEFDKIKEPQ